MCKLVNAPTLQTQKYGIGLFSNPGQFLKVENCLLERLLFRRMRLNNITRPTKALTSLRIDEEPYYTGTLGRGKGKKSLNAGKN